MPGALLAFTGRTIWANEQQVVDAIARTDYDQPIARQRANSAPAAPLPREGGVFRRFLDGFRYR
jgi:hypothetical protein